MHSDPVSYEYGSSKRAAAIASVFMGGANKGGLNSFLTASYDLDATEVFDALNSVDAAKAAHQLELVLHGLGTLLPAATQDDRWARLEERWSDDLDEHDVLARDADAELMSVLEKHVAANEAFYSSLD
jgi:hypothetical protein